MNEEPVCYTDAEGDNVTCGEGRTCVTGDCRAVPPYCSAAKPCAPGQTCREKNVCTCAEDAHCGMAGKCGADGLCFVACRSSSDCAPLICSPTGRCTGRCTSNLSCEGGQVCLLDEGYCVDPPEQGGEPPFSCSAGAFPGLDFAWVSLLALLVLSRRALGQSSRFTKSCGKKSTSGP